MNVDRIKIIYSELERYVVQLHPDPRSLGPLYLNDLIAKTRNYLNAVSLVQLEVHREKQGLSRDLRAHEAAYQVSFDDLLANDERVRRLPSIEDRKATAGVFLRDERQAIEALKAALQDLDFVDKAVRHRHKELTATMSEIKLQRSLIRDEIDTGAMYGDERATRAPATPVFDDISEAELAELVETYQGAPEHTLALPAHVAEPAPSAPAPEPPVSVPTSDPVQAAIDSFLGPDAPEAEIEDDLAKLLADLLPAVYSMGVTSQVAPAALNPFGVVGTPSPLRLRGHAFSGLAPTPA